MVRAVPFSNALARGRSDPVDQLRSPGRLSAIPLITLLVLATLALASDRAAAVTNTCRSRNISQDGPVSPDLQVVLGSADRHDRIVVRGVCVGSFSIETGVTIIGRAGEDGRHARLRAADQGRVVATTANVTLIDLWITGGRAGEGAGIHNSGILTLRRCRIFGNRSRFDGAGIFNEGKTTLDHSVVRDNRARSAAGGIWNENDAVLVLNDSTIRGNKAGVGGGIDNAGGTVVVNGNSSIRGNVATDFGGAGILSYGAVTMNDSSSLHGNRSLSEGGGIFNNGGMLTMNDRSSIAGNTTTRNGGGISIRVGGIVTLNDSSSVRHNRADFDDNGSGRGGGIFDCSVLIGAGANVDDNYLGSTGRIENNIATCD
jgi:hypothetical protein